MVTLPFNLGVGGAIRTGLRYAADRGYQRVVQLDGDGQHDVAEAKRLLDELEATGADFVVGARSAAGYDVSRTRRLAMRILSGIVSRRLGTSVHDTTSGAWPAERRRQLGQTLLVLPETVEVAPIIAAFLAGGA